MCKFTNLRCQANTNETVFQDNACFFPVVALFKVLLILNNSFMDTLLYSIIFPSAGRNLTST